MIKHRYCKAILPVDQLLETSDTARVLTAEPLSAGEYVAWTWIEEVKPRARKPPPKNDARKHQRTRATLAARDAQIEDSR